MSIEKDRAFAEVLRQLSTAELLDRYYRQTPELTDKVLTNKIDDEQLAEGPLKSEAKRS